MEVVDIPPAENWFKALPYAFQAMVGGETRIFFLPIAPQNISVITHFANNVIATLGATIEEHSDVRYYDISIVGTTGFTPQYTRDVSIGEVSKLLSGDTPKGQRKSYGESGSIIKKLSEYSFGFANQTINKIQQVANVASDLASGKKHQVGVYNDTNGYIAFHRFYNFLMKYKAEIKDFDKSNGQSSPLLFISYKDGIQYSCAIQGFSLERSADNPLLYNYSIRLRAYNARTISSSSEVESDIGKAVGLFDDPKSVASKIKNSIGKVKNIANGALSAIGTFGR